MAEYKFICQNGKSKVLNLHTSTTGTSIKEGTRFSLYEDMGGNDQTFVYESYGSYGILKSKRNTAYVVNRNMVDSNAIAWPWNTDDETVDDSLVAFEILDTAQCICRIKLVKQGLYLTAENTANGAAVTWSIKNSLSDSQQWKYVCLKPGGDTIQNTASIPTYPKNYAVYPCKAMRITQTYDGKTSHLPCSEGKPCDYPTDEAADNAFRSWMYCPCDEMEVYRVYGVGGSGVNTIWLRSTSKVVMPHGQDHLVMMVIHPDDDDLKKIPTGNKFTRGDAMFREGKDGAYAYHFHISVGTGNGFSGNGWAKNSLGSWVLTPAGKALKIEDAFYVDPNVTKILTNLGIPFRTLP